MQVPFFCGVEIRNKRPHMAHLDASRCCVIDDERAANNIFHLARILPPGSKVRISQVLPAMININVFGTSSSREAPAAGTAQQMILRVRWEDGLVEDIDLHYRVAPGETAQSNS